MLLLFAWGLDEIAATVGLIYAGIIALVALLVRLERGIDASIEETRRGRR